MHGLSSISATWSRFKLKTKNTKPMGDHSHINNDTHRLPHIWPYIFTPPPTSAQNPCFCQNCHPKSYFCHTVQNFWNFLLKDKSPWIWEKGTQMPPIFLWLLSVKDPLFFCLAYTFVWGECCSLKHRQKLENFVFSKQNQAIWWILSGANLIKVMKITFQFYRLHRPNCALYGWMSLEGRDDIQAIIHLVKHVRGYIL